MKSYSLYSHTEEDYLKAIYKISETSESEIATNAIAERLKTKASSVTDMLKKLHKKDLIKYKKYKGVSLTKKGEKIAIQIIRKHRLWEYFLVKKMDFKWDEVHDVAEQLEHIKSKLLVDKLDTYLGYPKYDPHGDPIPSANGEIRIVHKKTIDQLKAKDDCVIVGVKDHSTSFLQHLDSLKIRLGSKIKVLEQIKYDKSMLINLDDKKEILISNKVSKNIFVNNA